MVITTLVLFHAISMLLIAVGTRVLGQSVMVIPFAAGVAPPLRGVISHAGAMQTRTRVSDPL